MQQGKKKGPIHAHLGLLSKKLRNVGSITPQAIHIVLMAFPLPPRCFCCTGLVDLEQAGEHGRHRGPKQEKPHESQANPPSSFVSFFQGHGCPEER